jgi:putative SOS response-associated peptidase YedK
MAIRSERSLIYCWVTTTPNAVTAPFHDRMAVILGPRTYDLWLNPGMRDMATVRTIETL